MGRDQILTARAIEGLIAQGSTVVIFEEYVLRLDSWLNRHPGGHLAIEHMVGRDATDEIMAYHSTATLKTMKAYRIGRKPLGPWTNMTPPIRGGIYRRPSLSSIPSSADCSASSDISSIEHVVVADVTSLPDHAAAAAAAAAAAVSITSGCERGGPEAHAADEHYSITAASVAAVGLRSRSAAMAAAEQYPTPESSAASLAGSDLDVGDKTEFTASGRGPQPKCPIKYTDWAVQQAIEDDLRDFPSLEPQVQQGIVRRYRKLHQQVMDEGLYECRYIEYGKEMVRYTALFCLFIVALRHGWYMTSAVFLGLFWHQIMFTAHDAGHRAITQNFVFDTLVGMFIADFCCGLSIGWWKSSHNVHHLLTNEPEHDPDIQNVPLFATCPSFFRSIRSTYYDFSFAWDAVANLLVPIQRYTYYPVMGVARFNLSLLSWMHVLSSKSSSLGGTSAWWIRPTEIAFMTCYWFLFGYCLLWRSLPTWGIRVAFVLVSHIVTMPLHVQITLSHWGMSTADLGGGESFPQRQLRTTMDVDCPAWLDFIHGGLQFQAAHHMFPRVPRHNLRRAQALCMEFARDTNIPYSLLGFVDGNKKVMGRLGQVGDQVRILISCQKYMAETGESGLH